MKTKLFLYAVTAVAFASCDDARSKTVDDLGHCHVGLPRPPLVTRPGCAPVCRAGGKSLDTVPPR